MPSTLLHVCEWRDMNIIDVCLRNAPPLGANYVMTFHNRDDTLPVLGCGGIFISRRNSFPFLALIPTMNQTTYLAKDRAVSLGRKMLPVCICGSLSVVGLDLASAACYTSECPTLSSSCCDLSRAVVANVRRLRDCPFTAGGHHLLRPETKSAQTILLNIQVVCIPLPLSIFMFFVCRFSYGWTRI